MMSRYYSSILMGVQTLRMDRAKLVFINGLLQIQPNIRGSSSRIVAVRIGELRQGIHRKSWAGFSIVGIDFLQLEKLYVG